MICCRYYPPAMTECYESLHKDKLIHSCQHKLLIKRQFTCDIHTTLIIKRNHNINFFLFYNYCYYQLIFDNNVL